MSPRVLVKVMKMLLSLVRALFSRRADLALENLALRQPLDIALIESEPEGSSLRVEDGTGRWQHSRGNVLVPRLMTLTERSGWPSRRCGADGLTTWFWSHSRDPSTALGTGRCPLAQGEFQEALG